MSGRLPAPTDGVLYVFDGRLTGSGSAAAVTSSNELLVADSMNRTSNVTGAAVLISAAARRLCRIYINTVSAAATTFNDSATVAGAAAANLVFTIPANAAVGSIYDLDAPLTAGLVVTPGTSAVLTVTWS